jgi:hypothetical protein
MKKIARKLVDRVRRCRKYPHDFYTHILHKKIDNKLNNHPDSLLSLITESEFILYYHFEPDISV